MKKIIVLSIAFLMVAFVNVSTAQHDAMSSKKGMMAKKEMVAKKEMKKSVTKVVKLEQTEGEFNIAGLTLSAGTYVFEISNNGVDREVGFVLAPKGKTDAANHIKDGYVQKTIKDGDTSSSKEVTLTPGEYVYFCPLNPTPQYTITLK